MKKAVATLLTIATLFVMGGWTNPHSNKVENEFSLIDYLETHEIGSYSEFEAIIDSVSPESTRDSSSDSVTDFNVDIDYDNNIVSVVVVEEPVITSSGTGNTVSRSYYNDLGIKIFTISLTAYFHYSTGSVYTASASGSFSPAALSTWSSTPTISTGNYTSTLAYARISGTATSGSSSLNYSLTMTCDDTGELNYY